MTPPILFEPPWPLVHHPELWVLRAGPHATWTGAQVLWSEDGDDYDRHPPGEIGPEAVAGTLRDELPAVRRVDAPLVRVALDHGGTLVSVDDAAARRLQSLCYVGDGRNAYELVCTTAVRLLGKDGPAHVYGLGPCQRACYETVGRTHPAGSRFAVLDDTQVGRLVLPHRLVAARATLYVKLVPSTPEPDEAGVDPALLEPLRVRLEGRYGRDLGLRINGDAVTDTA